MADPINEIATYIRATKDVFDILKTLGGLLPRGPNADAAQQRLDQAEKALRASEAQLAQALGFHLCKCTFPPQIMLSKGRHPSSTEIFKCDKCGNQHPPDAFFRQQDTYHRDR